MNLYGYVGNNPLNSTDPMGLAGREIVGEGNGSDSDSAQQQNEVARGDGTKAERTAPVEQNDPRPESERTGGPDPSYEQAMEKIKDEIKDAEKQIESDMTPVVHQDTTGAGVKAQVAADATGAQSAALEDAAEARVSGDSLGHEKSMQQADKSLKQYHEAIDQPLEKKKAKDGQ